MARFSPYTSLGRRFFLHGFAFSAIFARFFIGAVLAGTHFSPDYPTSFQGPGSIKVRHIDYFPV